MHKGKALQAFELMILAFRQSAAVDIHEPGIGLALPW